ncbi:hypothetical protein DVH05_026858 [Phytophthora capsici]|nr:hypothetical protein DVH05_026858 [Phytophthora capsici]
MEALESRNGDITDGSSEDETIPSTFPSEIPQVDAKEDLGEDPQQRRDASGKVQRTHEDSRTDQYSDSVVPTSASCIRQVDIISVPKPKRQGRQRNTTKQLRQTKISQQITVHQYPSDLTVQLDELVIWARNIGNLKAVADMMERYPVHLEDAYLRSRTITCSWEAMRPSTYMHPLVIPMDLTRSMEAAIKDAKTEQSQPCPLTDNIKKQGIGLDLVAPIDPKLWKFSG